MTLVIKCIFMRPYFFPRYGRIESDDEDYDSEMDDFIDDDNAQMDISAQIRSVRESSNVV
jgi:hypothetical protein